MAGTNVNTNTGASGATLESVATVTIGGDKYQKMLVADTVTGTEYNIASEATLASIDGKTPALVSGRQPVDGSGVVQPVSATSLPLPNGAATESSLASVVSSLASLLTELQQKLEPGQNVGIGGIPVTGFYPGVLPTQSTSSTGLLVDEFGAVYTRGGITTDEASFRINNAGSSVTRSLPGTPTWTNGSATVTGSGFLSLTVPLLFGDYVKRDSDSETAYAQVLGVTDTEITLRTNYTGTTGAAAGSYSNYMTVTGSGGSIAVGSGNLTITSGTTNSENTGVIRRVDYGPLVVNMGLSLSQRIANQDAYCGFNTVSGDSRFYSRFRFNGTVNTVAICETGWSSVAPASGADVQSTTVSLPNGSTTASVADYRIEQDSRAVYFYINDVLLATHRIVAPRPYDVMSLYLHVTNGTGATSTNLIASYVTCNNYDSVRISPANQSDNFGLQNADGVNYSYNVAGVIAINTNLLTIDCSRFRCLLIQCISMGTTGVVTPQFSSDGGTTFSGGAVVPSAGGALATTFNAAGSWHVPVTGAVARLRLTTATTAGTTTIRVIGLQQIPALVLNTITVTATNLSTNVAQMNGVAVAMNNGVAGTGVQRVAIASDNTANSNPWLNTLVASAAQGASTMHRQAFVANITTGGPTSVKASAGTINAGQIANNSGVVVWAHFYNKASAPTLGTDTPVFSVLVKTGDTKDIDAGAYGDRFTTGIAYAVTDNCAAVPTAGGTITIASTAAAICVNLQYT